MEGFVSKDLSDGKGFNARFVDGTWELDKIFSADDFKDNFNRVLDEEEASKLLKEAKDSI